MDPGALTALEEPRVLPDPETGWRSGTEPYLHGGLAAGLNPRSFPSKERLWGVDMTRLGGCSPTSVLYVDPGASWIGVDPSRGLTDPVQ